MMAGSSISHAVTNSALRLSLTNLAPDLANNRKWPSQNAPFAAAQFRSEPTGQAK